MEKEATGGKAINSVLPSLVFLGTPEFAVPSLRRLVQAEAPILLVVTQPDRPSGRGRRVSAPPIKVVARTFGIPVYQPERIRNHEALDHICGYGAECAAVVAFGQLLPQGFLDAFPLGALNVHGSMLPAYRGAAPIQRCLLEGEKQTGISIMLLDAGMDTGPVLAKRKLTIGADDSFGSLHDRMAQTGAELLLETMQKWKAGKLVPEPQDNSQATYAPPILKTEARVAWELPARQIVNTIRAFDPFPGAYGFYQGRRLKLFCARMLRLAGAARPGEVAGLAEGGLAVWGGDGQGLVIAEVQLEGQRRLTAAEFIRGHPISSGSLLE